MNPTWFWYITNIDLTCICRDNWGRCSHSRIWIQLLQICILYLVGIGKDIFLVSIILIRFIGWIGYIPFHYPDMRIQINWCHLVDLQGNKREFWISFHDILTFEEIPYIPRDTSIEDIARIKILSPSGIML